MDEHNRSTRWVSCFHDVKRDTATACDFVIPNHTQVLIAMSGKVEMTHLLHAVLGIPRALQLAHVEDLAGVISVVRADVGDGGRCFD